MTARKAPIYTLKRFLLAVLWVQLSACQFFVVPDSEPLLESSAIREFPLFEGQNLVGLDAQMESAENDSLLVIARHFGLGFDEITRANPDSDPWLTEPGNAIHLPMRFIIPETPREGIVLNLAAKRLFLYPKKTGRKVVTYPVGIGREGWETPQGSTRIIAKKAHPSWTVPESILREHAEKGDPLPRVVPAGPNNPLGDYVLRLGFSGYLIHGTNKPYGVGMEVSHGCVRMYPEDISSLFRQSPVGTPVRIVNQPYLTAWDGDALYLQAYPPTHKDAKQINKLIKALMARLQKIERQSGKAIDWDKVHAAIERSDGVSTPILKDAGNDFQLTLPRPNVIFDRPIPEPISIEAWKLAVAKFENAKQARQFAAMLNHQGPPIPAHAIGTEVIAGPFSTSKEASSAKNRLQLEFSVTAELIEPGTDFEERPQPSSDSVFSSLLTFFD